MQRPSRVLITGAASGLGRALALSYARQGSRIIIADVQQSAAQETLSLVEKAGAEGMCVSLDVTQNDQWQRLACDLQAHDALPDIVINNAGVSSGGPFDWLSEADWQWVMDVNFFGVLKGCQTFVPLMKQRGSGHLVNIASMAGLLNPPGMSNYNVSKAAVISLSETLHMELQPFGVGVTCVCPSFFRTNLGDSLRSPDAATELALQKLMDSSNELTADDIAEQIRSAQQAGTYLVLPHDKAAQAWQFHNRQLPDYLASHYPLAAQMAQRAHRKDGK